MDTRLALAFLSGMFLVIGHGLFVTLFRIEVSEPILATGSGLMLATSAMLLVKGRSNGSGGEE
jgi:hypothetical protein